MKKVWLTLFLMAPILTVLALIGFIFVSLADPPEKQEPVGAGGGQSAGANYLGEWLAERRERGEREEAGLAAEMREAERAYQDERDGPDNASDNTSDNASSMVRPESLEQGFIIVVRDRSDMSSGDRPVYLASNHTGWNASAQMMSPRSDMRWQLVLPKPSNREPLEFKFTLGSWNSVETTPEGADTDNRTLPMIDPSRLSPGEVPVFEFEVSTFRESAGAEADVSLRLNTYRPLEVTGTVRRMQVSGGAGGAAGMVRDALIWLPPGYEDESNAGRRYPVLYMMDGQHVFERQPGVPGEFGADESATRLIEAGEIEPIIIVAIPHAERFRIDEYLPFGELGGSQGRGGDYVEWLRREVMPRVERAFRIKTGPEHTAIGGASLGGTIAIYAATKHPSVFGKVIAESLPLLSLEDQWRHWANGVTTWPREIFFGMGDTETGAGEADRNRRYVRAVRELEEKIRDMGSDRVRTKLVIGEGHTHNEPAWEARLPEALRFLFPAE
ncbi:MAG: hypothetical protein EA378_02700 [Phycisphaerales bacterium]|nr:MAG: hypothetical protein EA378_02700 [Phycisphaerales bacterium]